ncbi:MULTISPECIES: hypothetical protein [Mucilaginibacter]|uniref:hypothetical protein n=1 Tax=Mucilaginibacter TaxID=423349 RepID=UPI001FB49A7D|nr:MULTISPECIES: hypothetical protein [Mucilaginibacter]MDN3551209.1 hypothetical protein [Mucilaginibacter aquaedulcis]UOE52486.1 hypothetical protein MTO98_15530 [Mucilaginibacter sp. SMC90]
MITQNEDYKNIPGWGMDADPENEPTYPMKNYTGDDHSRINYERAEHQPQDVEILMSNERPAMTRVFGTAVPPSGLSGMIRRYAFQHSEDRYRHWIPLILADRVNVFEGLIADIGTGHLPNFIKERGLAMEWKYNRTGLLKKAATAAVIGVVLVAWIRKKK